MSPDSTPIVVAHIILVSGDDRRDSTLSDTSGRYLLVMRSDSGMYELRVRAFGYHPLSTFVQRDTVGSNRRRGVSSQRIIRDVVLNPVAVVLEPVAVTGSRIRFDQQNSIDTRETWASFLAEKLPLDVSSFNEIASLQPGVSRVGPDGALLSIAGQGPTQNRTTVDGASDNGAGVPAEAVRSIGVISNTYDPSYGLFSGGQVSATTLSGTDIWGGSFTAHMEDPALKFGTLPGSLARNQRTLTASAGVGGPILTDRLFVFGAIDASASRSPVLTLPSLGPAALQRLELSPDSAQRFLEIAGRLGIPIGRAPTTSGTDFTSYLARLDYVLSDHTTVTARLTQRFSTSGARQFSPLVLSSTIGNSKTSDLLASAQVTTTLAAWANQFQLSRGNGRSNDDPGATLPGGEVDVISSLGSGVLAPSTVGFGGVPSSSSDGHSLIEVRDDVVRQGTNSAHRLEGGFLVQDQRESTQDVTNTNGLFVFNSLADIDSGRPTSYSRELGAVSGAADRTYLGSYVGDSWAPDNFLNITYGMRADADWYGKRPPRAPQVRSLDPEAEAQPSREIVFTPRVGAAYVRPRWSIRGGFGGFFGPADLRGLAGAFGETGTATRRLVCVGSAAPVPDWSEYLSDSGAIPSRCAQGSSEFAASTPSATVFEGHFGSPRTWRASLGGSWGLSHLWGVSINALLVSATHLPNAVDLNLVANPRFTLANEGSRPVFELPNTIDPSSGGSAPAASRRDTSLGLVSAVSSDGKSRTAQATLGVNGTVGRTLLALAYTFTNSRVLGGAVPAPNSLPGTTSGDPRQLEWEDNELVSRHIFQLVASQSLGSRLTIGAIGRYSSGVPFTPTVAGDVNGDGLNDDRAFVFGASGSLDTSIAAGMMKLERGASTSIRNCLISQTGRIAGPGSCHTPWSPSLDLSLRYQALGNVNTRRLTVLLTASNVTAGLDYLLHGPNHIRGWGQFPNPDATLLQVRGFNAEDRAFMYAVNPHFGQPLQGGLLSLPFRLTLQARVTFGSDPRYQPLLSAIRNQLSNTSASLRGSVEGFVHNIPDVTLQLAAEDTASLRLTLRQRRDLRLLADSLKPIIQASVDSLVASLQERGPITAVRSARLQQRVLQAQKAMQAAIDGTRRLLTPEQWVLIPAWVIRRPTVHDLEKPSIEVVVPGTEP